VYIEMNGKGFLFDRDMTKQEIEAQVDQAKQKGATVTRLRMLRPDAEWNGLMEKIKRDPNAEARRQNMEKLRPGSNPPTLSDFMLDNSLQEKGQSVQPEVQDANGIWSARSDRDHPNMKVLTVVLQRSEKYRQNIIANRGNYAGSMFESPRDRKKFIESKSIEKFLQQTDTGRLIQGDWGDTSMLQPDERRIVGGFVNAVRMQALMTARSAVASNNNFELQDSALGFIKESGQLKKPYEKGTGRKDSNWDNELQRQTREENFVRLAQRLGISMKYEHMQH
jgi:hypothetical protein